jgi:outer membrane immunogenic protein
MVTVVALFIVGEAMAADPAGVAPVFTWTGPYGGLNAGYGWSQRRDRGFASRGLTVDVAPDEDDGATTLAPVEPVGTPPWVGRNKRRDGALIGAQLGYNYQFGAQGGWVVGVEADAQLADFGKHIRGLGATTFTAVPVEGAIDPVEPEEPGNVELFGNALRPRDRDHSDAFATIRLRLGYAFGRWLFFGTGGFAVTETIPKNFAEVNGEAPDAAVPLLFPERRRIELGWTVGAGVEYALNESWTAKVEGLYVNMPGRSDNVANGIVGVSNTDAPIRAGALGVSRRDDDFFVARLGLNYHFGRGGAGLFPQIWEEETSNGSAKRPGAAEEDGGGEDEDDRHEPAGGAASNEEEEDGGEEGWQLKAKLNRAFLFWHDGRGGAHFVDSDQDSTGFEAERKFDLGSGWEAVLKFGFDTKYASSDSVHQHDRDGDGARIDVADALLELGHEKWGKFVVGHYDSASDNINKINLSGSNVLADPEVEQWNGSFFLRMPGLGLADGRGIVPGAVGEEGESIQRADLRWGDFTSVPLGGRTGRFVTYVTPQMMGFQAAASVGQPQDIEFFQGNKWFQERTGGLVQDAAVRYRGHWSDFIVAAGIGAWKDTAEEPRADEPTRDIGWGASAAVFHKPTGLNVAVNYGNEEHSPICAEPGLVSGRCRGDDRFLYVKGGIHRDYFAWGPTALYGEYLRNWKNQHESDENLLRTVELNVNQASELKSSVASVWGLGIVQTIKPSRDRNYITDLYVGYRHHSLDLDLLGAIGPVASRKPKDFDTVMAGVRFRWGERLQPVGAEDD